MKATNILWDAPDNVKKALPDSIDIPENLHDIEDMEEYISAATGWCTFGFVLSE